MVTGWIVQVRDIDGFWANAGFYGPKEKARAWAYSASLQVDGWQVRVIRV